jgi:hypothetical protein
MPWSVSASTGLILMDMLIRPMLKFGMKFPIVGILLLCIVYTVIGYHAVKSAFFSDLHMS